MTVGKVITEASMSLDGFIAKQDNTIGRLFDWLQNGDLEIPTPAKDFSVHLTPQTAEHWRRWTSQLGALVVGRTLFDFVDGWNGRHTLDVPVVVVTHQIPTNWVESHPDAPFSFVTDGVEAAVSRAQQIAGDRTVFVSAGTIARQCLELGLLDEVMIDLVPVVMGKGRPFFGELSLEDVPLGDPTVCIQGKQVTHLVFPVARS
jgi:dihydrofolate reductase